MKRKLIEINECSECPYNWQFADSLECTKMSVRIIPDPLDIPEWCPLPDANSVEQVSRMEWIEYKKKCPWLMLENKCMVMEHQHLKCSKGACAPYHFIKNYHKDEHSTEGE